MAAVEARKHDGGIARMVAAYQRGVQPVGLLMDKDDESTLIPEVEVSEIEGYKQAGVIAGGMLPKIEGMADAIYQGVHEAVIIDGRVPHSILLEMFSDRGAGTMFYRRGNR